MHRLLAVLLIIALLLASQASAATLTCQVIPNRIGQPVCHCRTSRPGSTWQVYLMIVCQLVNR